MERYLAVDALSKTWPMKKIELSFSMERGEALAILGPSGCGKSSVLRMIAGLLAPDSGTIVLGGRNLLPIPAGRRNVGMVFQESALFPHLRVGDNIAYGLVSRGMGKKEARKEAELWLGRISLAGFAQRRIDSLSGGEKQRVSLARTLATSPDLVLFDEPLSALDADLRSRLRDELRSRQKELGYTAVYVTHDREEALVLADRVITMI